MSKVKIATVWLDGCSGCHMSFLDMDERLLALAGRIELLYSPLVDFKQYPDMVDIALVEGAVSSTEDEKKVLHIRRHTKTLVAMGDCAVTGNVSAMRNIYTPQDILDRAYKETAEPSLTKPFVIVPSLNEKSRPLHECVAVDIHLPGCPPSANTFYAVLTDLLAGRTPDIASLTRFGS